MMYLHLAEPIGQRLWVLLRVCGFSAAGQRPRANAWVDGNHMDDRWLSVDEIAVYLGVKRDTVYKWIDRKNFPAHKAGRLWKFRKEEIDEWVRSGRARSVTGEVG